jgi:hypothetical protein
MSGVSEAQAKDGARPQKPKAPGKKEIKILMLHGKLRICLLICWISVYPASAGHCQCCIFG